MTEPRPSPLDVLSPFAGPCAICGGPDKRHRLADSIVGAVRAGETYADVADDYVVSTETIQALLETATRNARRHRARWSA